MLRFAAAGKSGDYREIASETGIPMGNSSGKVPAIIDYCRGMGRPRKRITSIRLMVADMMLSRVSTGCSNESATDGKYVKRFYRRSIL